MKRFKPIFFTALLVAAAVQALAQYPPDAINVYVNGESNPRSTLLTNFQRITFAGGNMQVKPISGTEQTYPFANWRKITFGDEFTIGIDDAIAAGSTDIVVYPNPANSEIRIMNYEFVGNERIEIFDFAGRCVQKIVSSAGAAPEIINVSNLISGIYFIKINEQTVKFIKE